MATTQYTTFGKFLKDEKIEIPIIQRDYAQGRNGKEKLREKFLKDLKYALDNPEHKLKLDFVYGSVEDNKIQPLDGQQRLTTLWLLHWYIAFKTGKLSENIEIFKRFSYETRTSSREFCNRLSEFSINQPIKDGKLLDIIEHVQNQTWFCSAWKQDPTIQAMLNMLGGTNVKEKEKDIIDGIEELLAEVTVDKFVDYWNTLTGENSPIIFYYMPLNELKMSDDLYIKMNARGKPLTNFENFKADFVGFINELKLDEKCEPQNTIAHKLDTIWTDLFWKFKSPEHKIDEIYFAFLNRYFVNSLITAKNPELTQKEIETNKAFVFLTGNQSEVYSGFEIYELIAKIDIEIFFRLSKILTEFSSAFENLNAVEINKLFHPNWDNNSNFRFIPEYFKDKENSESITTLTQPHRVIFHAICSYFEINQYEEVSFKRWMRIVWNIVENSNIEGTSSMIGAMRLIDELKGNSNDIYNFLYKNEIKSDTAKEQVAEEKEKARQTIDNPRENWEDKIIEAEKTAFFHGAIRFLFRVAENKYNWNIFDDRLKIANLYFSKNEVTADFRKDAKLLRFLISKFNSLEEFYPLDNFRTQIYYDNNILNWKNILTHRAYIKPVNELLDEKIECFNYDAFTSTLNDRLKIFQEELVKTSILSEIVPECTFHYWNYGGYYSLYPYNTKSQSKIYVLADKRNEILNRLEKHNIIEVDNWQKINNLPFYKGWEINFTLKSNNKKYQWWGLLREEDENGNLNDIPNVDLNNLESYLMEIKV